MTSTFSRSKMRDPARAVGLRLLRAVLSMLCVCVCNILSNIHILEDEKPFFSLSLLLCVCMCWHDVLTPTLIHTALKKKDDTFFSFKTKLSKN